MANEKPKRPGIVQVFTGRGGNGTQNLLLIGGLALAAGAALWWWFKGKKPPIEPGEVEQILVQIFDDRGNLLYEEGMVKGAGVISERQLTAKITWRNAGERTIAPTFRFDLRPVGPGIATWKEGAEYKSPEAAAGETVIATAKSIPIPGPGWGGMGWEPGDWIDMKLMLIGQEGAWWLAEKVVVIIEYKLGISDLTVSYS